MHSRPMTIDKLLQLMVPMSVGLVSHTVVHDNTSGHLHVVVVKINQLWMKHDLVMLVTITIDIRTTFCGSRLFL